MLNLNLLARNPIGWKISNFRVTFHCEFGMYFTSPSRTAIRTQRRTPAPLTTERITTMISDIIGQLATGSSAFDTGSAVANGGFDLIGTVLTAFEGLLTSFGS